LFPGFNAPQAEDRLNSYASVSLFNATDCIVLSDVHIRSYFLSLSPTN
jgi:hypothetical protein